MHDFLYSSFRYFQNVFRTIQELKQCDIIEVKSNGPILNVFRSFAFKKDSPYVNLFNHHLKNFLYNGLIPRTIMRHNAFVQNCPKPETKSIGYQKCLVAFLPMAAGIAISLVLLVFESIKPKTDCTKEDKPVDVNALFRFSECMVQDIKNQIQLLNEEISYLEQQVNDD